jgi:hypothetical protein
MKRCIYIFVLALLVGFMSGCMTSEETISFSYRDPLLRFTNNGLMFRDKYVTPKQAMELMEKHRIPKNVTIHLLVDDDYRDERAMWVFQRNYLARTGYTKSVLIRNMHPEVRLVDEDERRMRGQPKETPKPIRYKGANER